MGQQRPTMLVSLLPYLAVSQPATAASYLLAYLEKYIPLIREGVQAQHVGGGNDHAIANHWLKYGGI